MFEVLWYYLLLSMIINVAVFFVAYLLSSDTFTDITYALTFVLLIVISFVSQPFESLKFVYAAFVVVWAFRLGIYLFNRIQFFGHDKRFDAFRDSFVKFLGFFLLQGLTVFVVLIPAFLFMQLSVVFSWIVIIGMLIWIKGFIFETIADNQKFAFIKDKKNKGKFISIGLWKYSRHPNYYGEILCWLGLYLIAFPSLHASSMTMALVGFIGPLYIFLLLRYVSGVRILERRAKEKYGSDKKYKEYVKRTGMFIPRFW